MLFQGSRSHTLAGSKQAADAGPLSVVIMTWHEQVAPRCKPDQAMPQGASLA